MNQDLALSFLSSSSLIPSSVVLIIEQHSPQLPVSSYNRPPLSADPKNDVQFTDDLSHCGSLVICPEPNLDFPHRQMSTSTPDTDTSSMRDKKHSPSISPQPDHKPCSDDAWSFNDKQLINPTLDNTPKVQLPSIFTTFEDPFHNDIRHTSLPSISSDPALNTCYRASPYTQPTPTDPSQHESVSPHIPFSVFH
ncbi:hypothetical protein L210DRAFT_989709 [Boletus edulis BED1]|uniref:Uncharacterized protein n=1 Tax=Boletus edulis BED1 TaxID=1328754 RepID=A0AAD4B9Z7_BOLED|nr:hypothetical protein L210DRAFT_989709 [Boletus edulis BED1]